MQNRDFRDRPIDVLRDLRPETYYDWSISCGNEKFMHSTEIINNVKKMYENQFDYHDYIDSIFK